MLGDPWTDQGKWIEGWVRKKASTDTLNQRESI